MELLSINSKYIDIRILKLAGYIWGNRDDTQGKNYANKKYSGSINQSGAGFESNTWPLSCTEPKNLFLKIMWKIEINSIWKVLK